MQINKDMILRWRQRPDEWIETFLDCKLTPKQVEICRALARYKKVTVRSCHGVGKSFVASALVHWFQQIFPPTNKVVSTAPTTRQVKKILWSEIGDLHHILSQKISTPGELLQTELRFGPNHWAVGYSTDDPNAFQGIHARYVLGIFDEACGIARDIFEASEGILTGKDNYVLLIGNPTEPNTYFHETHVQDVGFYRVKMSFLDSPNIGVREDGTYYDIDPLPFPALTTLDWVERMIKKHGRNSPFVISRVFGEFPQSATDQLISDKAIAAAIAKGAMLRKIVGRFKDGREVIDSHDIYR